MGVCRILWGRTRIQINRAVTHCFADDHSGISRRVPFHQRLGYGASVSLAKRAVDIHRERVRVQPESSIQRPLGSCSRTCFVLYRRSSRAQPSVVALYFLYIRKSPISEILRTAHLAVFCSAQMLACRDSNRIATPTSG